MSMLTKKPPLTVRLCGVETPVNADFRVMLRIEELAEQGLEDAARGVKSLLLFYGALPEDIGAATECMLWFMWCGEQEKEGKGRGRPVRPDFSFSFDAPYIYAAFLDQYGIDLVETEFLHWWKFRALLDGLRPEHRFCEIRRCRAMDVTKIKDKEQQRYYREMKKLYALPLPDDEQQRVDLVTDALMHGGNLSALL